MALTVNISPFTRKIIPKTLAQKGLITDYWQQTFDHF
jgi:hypothetical protein